MENPAEHPHSNSPGSYNSNAAPQNLPNSNLILILGILSIFLCWWHFVSIAGIVLGIIALVLARKETALYYMNPARYTISSLNNVKTGRICAIIGLTIAIVVFAFVMLLIIGVLATVPFWGMIH
jgi:uncharacterized membrane-anchored protein